MQIIKSAHAKLKELTREEVQLGKTKIFVRKPETFFMLEKLREERIDEFAAKIQAVQRSRASRSKRNKSAASRKSRTATAVGRRTTETPPAPRLIAHASQRGRRSGGTIETT